MNFEEKKGLKQFYLKLMGFFFIFWTDFRG